MLLVSFVSDKMQVVESSSYPNSVSMIRQLKDAAVLSGLLPK